ncbi:hypothetical protein [Nocardioides sp. YIM 152315]|uniref:hypothetical protein n=1 Tax=Nocardioides sp. YIM 152315 TaxID=3031760 RepID=UPI0023DC4A34|nr:hypothetical protein [Nocardioides sp. YIM 152315]MDF1603124.1 hypothetical protein [Nocardioides sp. YIM 152315]
MSGTTRREGDLERKKKHDQQVDAATPAQPGRVAERADGWGPQSAAAVPIAGLVTGPVAGPASGPVIRRDFTDLFSYVPAAPEWVKERIDPRRSKSNPYWQQHNTGERSAEATLPGYHSTSRHGAENTLQNMEQRTAKVGKKSGMTNLLTGLQDIPSYKVSSRFATPAWHMYALNVAKREFVKQVAPTVPGNFTWPVAGGAGPIPKHGNPGVQNAAFSITFTKNIVGYSVQAGDTDGARTDTVYVAVNYLTKAGAAPAAGAAGPVGLPQADTAVIGQFFPVPAPKAAAGPGIANVTIPYSEVPWFSTDA